MPSIVHEYNTDNYPVALKGLTPEEAFHQTPVDFEEIRKDFHQARVERMRENRLAGCGNC